MNYFPYRPLFVPGLWNRCCYVYWHRLSVQASSHLISVIDDGSFSWTLPWFMGMDLLDPCLQTNQWTLSWVVSKGVFCSWLSFQGITSHHMVDKMPVWEITFRSPLILVTAVRLLMFKHIIDLCTWPAETNKIYIAELNRQHGNWLSSYLLTFKPIKTAQLLSIYSWWNALHFLHVTVYTSVKHFIMHAVYCSKIFSDRTQLFVDQCLC